MRISDWSSDVCSSDLRGDDRAALEQRALHQNHNPSPFALSLSKGAVLSFGGARRRTVLRQAQHERKEGRCRFMACRSKIRSEEHTSELQSLMRISYAVFCLKKKTNKYDLYDIYFTRTHKTQRTLDIY